jgi:uncharacterized membrane protein
MQRFGLFLHVLGVALWLGASLSFMVIGPAAKRMPLVAWAHTWQVLARVQRIIVAPAAAVTTVTGILLTMSLAGTGFEMGNALWLMIMQGLGLLAGALALVVATPLINRMAVLARRSLEQGQVDPAAERVRRAVAIAGSVSGVLVLVALWFGVTRSA